MFEKVKEQTIHDKWSIFSRQFIDLTHYISIKTMFWVCFYVNELTLDFRLKTKCLSNNSHTTSESIQLQRETRTVQMQGKSFVFEQHWCMGVEVGTTANSLQITIEEDHVHSEGK